MLTVQQSMPHQRRENSRRWANVFLISIALLLAMAITGTHTKLRLIDIECSTPKFLKNIWSVCEDVTRRFIPTCNLLIASWNQPQTVPTPTDVDGQVDVYVMTYSFVNRKLTYWKNGVETQKFSMNGFIFGNNFHSGSNGYWIANGKHPNGRTVPTIYKNGSVLYHLSDGKSASSADRVFVSGNDVYAAGYEMNPKHKGIATVWKNGRVLYHLTDGNFNAGVESIFVSNNDVYAAGYENSPLNKFIAAVWKNGKLMCRLTNGTFHANTLSIFVSGGDVYVAGYEDNPRGKEVATVWKNGKPLYSFTNGTFNARVSSLFVSGSDVYAAGFENNSQNIKIITIWKNDKLLYRLNEGNAVLVFAK